MTRTVAEGTELVLNLPEAFGMAAARLERLEPPLTTGSRVGGIWSNDRWTVTASANGSVDVFQRITLEQTETAINLPLNQDNFGELAQAVIKADDAILLSRSGNFVVYRLRPVAAGGPVQVGQLVGPLPPAGFAVSGLGRRSGPGVNVDYLYVPAGAEGVALYDLTLEWFPRAVRTLQATRRFGQLGLEVASPIGAPVSVAALTDVLAVTTGGRDIRLFEEFFFSTWETVDRGGWQAGEGETVSLLCGQSGRLYAVVQSEGGTRLQTFTLSNRVLTPRGSLVLPGATDFTSLERFGPDFIALTRRHGGTVVVSVANPDSPETITSLDALNGADTTALATEFPHLWVNDRPANASHLVLSHGDSAFARYAPEGELPDGMTLTPAGELRWTPGEDRGGTRVNVRITRIVPGTTNHLIAEVIVEEANQAPAISPVANQQLVAGLAWTLRVNVSDPDVPAQVLSLSSDHPQITVGARGADGTFPLTWTPLAEAAPSPVTLIVRDNAGGSATNQFQLSVVSRVHRLRWTEFTPPPPAENWPFNLIPPRNGQNPVFSVSAGHHLPSGIDLNVNGRFEGFPDEEAGQTTNTFTVIAVIAGETNHLFYSIVVDESDTPPELTPILDQVYAYGRELVIPVVVRDPDGRANSFDFTVTSAAGAVGEPPLPALAVVNREIRWTPDPSGPRLGSYWITVKAVERLPAEVAGQPDTIGLASQTTFRLSPTLENLPPYWADPQPLIQLRATEGRPLQFPPLRVLDPNGPVGRLDSYGTSGPAGVPGFPLAPQPDGGVVIPDWTPREDAGGRTWQFTLVANDQFDQSLTATNVIMVEVAEVNGPPVWLPVPVQQGIVGRQLELDLRNFVTDPDRLWVDDALVPDPLTFQLLPGNPIPGNPTVTPDGVLSWTPVQFIGCEGSSLVVEARDSAGNTARGQILLSVSPLIPLASTITNRLEGEVPNQENRLVANAVLGWNMGHDLRWLHGLVTNDCGPVANLDCLLKAYRSLSWPGAKPNARRLDGNGQLRRADVESRGIARLTNLVALPRTAAFLGDDRGELWLRFGEYHLGRSLAAADTDVEGVDWGYVAATTNEWRIYRAKPLQNQLQRGEIWYYDAGGNGFRLTQTVDAQPVLHLNIAYHDLTDLNDDTITAQTEECEMEESFDQPFGAPQAAAAFARGLAAVVASELADRRLSVRMDQMTAVDTALPAQAAIQCAPLLLDPGQQICNTIAPMRLYAGNGAILISGCDNLSVTNRPPDLQPIGVIPAVPGQLLSIQLRASDPDIPRQPLTFSLDAESVHRGLRVDGNGLLTWNVPADAGCTEVSGIATVQDPEPLADSEAFTIRIAPRRFAVPFSGVFEERRTNGNVVNSIAVNEGMIATDSARGHRLDWLPVGDGGLPTLAARRWATPDVFPNYAAAAHPNGPVPFRGARFTLSDRNVLPRTQGRLRDHGLEPGALGFRFDLSLADDVQGLDWNYEPATGREWRHYTGAVKITLRDTVLFHLPGQRLHATLDYDPNLPTTRVRAATGPLVLGANEPLDPAMAAIAQALREDLGDGFARLNFAGMPVATGFNRIEKGFPVVWHNLFGELEVFSCEAPYVAPYVLSPGALIVDEGEEAFTELRVIPPGAANLSFQLVQPPADPQMRLTADGKFHWPTDEFDGGRNEIVNVHWTDGITEGETRFTVTVRELNSAPTLAEIPAQFVSEGGLLRVRLNAQDSDRPRQRLEFNLDEDSLNRGFWVDPRGNLTWRPGWQVRSGFTTRVEARVSDGWLDAARSFQVTVLPRLALFVGMRALDGYLAGATVWWDADLDGQPDAGEPATTTDRSGDFELQLDLATWDRNGDGRLGPTDGRLVATGGVDLMTGLPFRGRLTAPADAAVISPLSTLLERLTRDGNETDEAAQERLRSRFGLPPGVDLAVFDPLPAAAAEDPAALRIQTANAVIADTVAQLAAALTGDGGNPATADEAVWSAWSRQLQKPATAASGSPASVRNLLDQAAETLAVTLPERLAATVATVVGAQNEAKQAAAVGGDGLERLARLQAGSLLDTLPALRSLTAGTATEDDLRLGQDSWRQNSLAALPSEDPLGTGPSPGRFALSRTNLTVREDGTSDQTLAVVRAGGASGTAVVELGLSDSANGLSTNRLTLAFRDGERFRSLDWSALLVDDTRPNPDRTITVTLTGASASAPGVSLGDARSAVATVLDDDAAGSLAFSGTSYRHAPGTPSMLSLVRQGGVAGQLVAKLDFAAAGQTFPPVEIEFPPGVSRRIVPLPELTGAAVGGTTVTVNVSLTPDSAPGGTVGTPAEVRVAYAAAATPLRILRLEAAGTGSVRLSVVGPAGNRHRIEASTDLIFWAPLSEAGELATQGDTPVTAEVPTTAPGRFLRLRPVGGD